MSHAGDRPTVQSYCESLKTDQLLQSYCKSHWRQTNCCSLTASHTEDRSTMQLLLRVTLDKPCTSSVTMKTDQLLQSYCESHRRQTKHATLTVTLETDQPCSPHCESQGQTNHAALDVSHTNDRLLHHILSLQHHNFQNKNYGMKLKHVSC